MTAEYYKLDVGGLPDELFSPDVPATQWLERCETSRKGFPRGSLRQVHKIPFDVEAECVVGLALYLFGNVFPFLIVPGVLLSALGGVYRRYLVGAVVSYGAVLSSVDLFDVRRVGLTD